MAIVIHNLKFDCPTLGTQSPAYTTIPEPFIKPFTYGPQTCRVKDGSHVGIRTQEPIAAAFVGSTGDFLALSPNTFVIVTPKMQHCTYAFALFPNSETHNICLAEKGQIYPIRSGCAILAGADSDGKGTDFRLRNITLFFKPNFRQCLDVLHHSLFHFNRIWTTVAERPSLINIDRFSSIPPSDLPIESHLALRCVATMVQSIRYPLPKKMERVLAPVLEAETSKKRSADNLNVGNIDSKKPKKA